MEVHTINVLAEKFQGFPLQCQSAADWSFRHILLSLLVLTQVNRENLPREKETGIDPKETDS